jgi:hypothetical protein
MENQNVPIKMWKVTKHRLRINKAVVGWNYKPSSIIGKQQPNDFLQVQKVKEEAELVSWQPKSKEPGVLVQKRRKTYVKEDNIIKYLWNNTVNKIICTNT